MLNAFGVVLIVLGALAALIPVVAGTILHHVDHKVNVKRDVVAITSTETQELVSASS